ncbi:MAG: FtsK/SpoIIIE domain-containing protein [Coprobacillaceae bacterium]
MYKKKYRNRKHKVFVARIPLIKIFIWIFHNLRSFYWKKFNKSIYDYWIRFDKAINRLGFVALEYGRKENRNIDVNKIPRIKYQFKDNIMSLAISFKILVTDDDYEKLLKKIKTNTNLVVLSYKIDMGVCYVEVANLSDNMPIEQYISKDNLYKVPIATSYGKVLYWNYTEHPHLLINGATGGGKSVFDTYLLSSLCRYFKIDLVDGKSVDFSMYEKYLNRYGDSLDLENAYSTIYNFEQEMLGRYAILKELGLKTIYSEGCDLEPRFLVIEEFSRIIESIQDIKERKRMDKCINNLLALGRAAGMHLILSMQRADTKYITGDARNNLTIRIALGSNEVETYRMLFNDGTLMEEYGKGHGVLSIGGKIYRICTPFVKDIKLE